MKAREFDSVVSKFGFDVEKSHHVLAWLTVDGKKVVRTRRSHGRGDVPAAHAIRQQLKLSQSQLDEAISCTLGRDGYLEILRDKGII